MRRPAVKFIHCQWQAAVQHATVAAPSAAPPSTAATHPSSGPATSSTNFASLILLEGLTPAVTPEPVELSCCAAVAALPASGVASGSGDASSAASRHRTRLVMVAVKRSLMLRTARLPSSCRRHVEFVDLGSPQRLKDCPFCPLRKLWFASPQRPLEHVSCSLQAWLWACMSCMTQSSRRRRTCVCRSETVGPSRPTTTDTVSTGSTCRKWGVHYTKHDVRRICRHCVSCVRTRFIARATQSRGTPDTQFSCLLSPPVVVGPDRVQYKIHQADVKAYSRCEP